MKGVPNDRCTRNRTLQPWLWVVKGLLLLGVVPAWLPVLADRLPLHPDLVAWYPMDANRSELVLEHSPTSDQRENRFDFVRGKVGIALRVHDTSESQLLNPRLARDGGQRFTIDLWVRVASEDGLRADAPFAPFLRAGVNGAWYFGLGGGGRLRLRSGDGGVFESVGRIADTGWHHVALTRDDAWFAFYVDGVLAGEGDTGWSQGMPTDLWYVGRVGPDSPFRGDLDEFAVHSAPLPARDIHDIVTAGGWGREGSDLAVSSISGTEQIVPGADVELEWTVSNVGERTVAGRGIRVTHRDLVPGARVRIGDVEMPIEGWSSFLSLPTLAPGAAVTCRMIGKAGTTGGVGGSVDVSVPPMGWDRYPSNNRAEWVFLPDWGCAGGRGEGLASWLAFEGDAVDRITGGVAQGSAGAGYEPGLVGGALRLTGLGGVTAEVAALSGLKTFAWEAWVRPVDGGARYGVLASVEGVAGQPGMGIAIARTSEATDGYHSIPGGALAVRITPGLVGSVDANGWLDGGLQLPAGRWSHVAVSVGGGWLTTYLNGWEVRKVRLVPPEEGLVAAPLRIGHAGSGVGAITGGFTGLVDESAFYDSLTYWNPGVVVAAGRSGRCRADLAVKWKKGPGSPRPNIGFPLGFVVENVGVGSLSGITALFELPSSWGVLSVRATGGVVQLETNLAPARVRLRWRHDGVLNPGESREVDFEVLAMAGSSQRLFVSSTTSEPQLLFRNDNAALEMDGIPRGDIFVGTVRTTEPPSGTNVVEFPVWLGRVLDREVQVDVLAEAASAVPSRAPATPGRDFIPKTSRLVFPAGVLTQWFRVEVLADDVYEAREGIGIRLRNPVGADIEVLSGVVEVNDSGVTPTVQVGSAARVRPAGPGEQMEFPLVLSMPSEVNLRFNYFTTNRTALAGVDYVATNGVVEFPAGTDRRVITVNLLPTPDSPDNGWFQVVGQLAGFGTMPTSPTGGIGTLETRQGASSAVAVALDVDATTAEAGAEVPIRVQALDWRRQPHRAAGEGVRVFAVPATGRPHPVVMSVVGIRGQITLQSTVNEPLSLENWSLTLYDDTTWPHPTLQWRGGATNLLAPLGSAVIQVLGPAPANSAIRWDPSWQVRGAERPMAVMLRDPAGNVTDFFSHGDARPGTMLYPVRLDPADWPGFEVGLRPQPRVLGGIAGAAAARFMRYGAETRGAASEWRVESAHGMAPVTGMSVPWRASTVPREPIRDIALGADGAWEGTVKLPAGPGNWVLGVELPNGVRSFSGPIRIGDPADVGIVSFEMSSPVVMRQSGQASYRLVISNGSPRTATGVVARIPVPSGVVQSNLWLSTTRGSAQMVPGNAVVGARIEATIGELPAGEVVELRGTMEGFRIDAQSGQLLWAGLAAESSNGDQANDFAVTPLELMEAPVSRPVPIAFWRGEGDFLDRVGTNHAVGIGPVEFVPRGSSRAFRLGSPEAGIELPSGLAPDPGTNGSEVLHFLFRLPLVEALNESRILVSAMDPNGSGSLYTVEHRDGVIRVWVGGQPLVFMPGLVSRPYDVRDGQWHHLSLELHRTSGGVPLFLVGVDEQFSFRANVQPGFSLMGRGVRVMLGGGPGLPGFEGDLDEIALFRDPVWTSRVEQLALGNRLPESVLSSALEGQAAFLPPDSATEGRPFRLRLLHENTGPVMASNVVVALRFPPSWTLQSGAGNGGTVRRPGTVEFLVDRMAPGARLLHEYRFLAPRGSNSVEVAFVPQPGVAVFRRATIPVVVSADADSDGLPDSWEVAAGLSASDPSDARSDNDGDGIDVLGEFEAGTLPNDPGSVLRLRWMPAAGGGLGLRADSIPGRTYVLERLSGSFSAPAWEPVRALSGTGAELDFGSLPGDRVGDDYLRVRVIRDR